MFEELQPKSPQTGGGAEPDDIFAGTDSGTDMPPAGSATPATDAGVMSQATPPENLPGVVERPKAPMGSMPAQYANSMPQATNVPQPMVTATRASEFPIKKIILGVVFFVLIVVSVILAFSFFGVGRVQPEPEPTLQETTPPVTTPQVETPVAPTPPPTLPTPPVQQDSDRDGLTDEKEAEIGTSSRNSDTDADGLSDRDEVEVWLTDPLDPDTDGDTYLDGVEVSGGYNPLGPGKIQEIPK